MAIPCVCVRGVGEAVGGCSCTGARDLRGVAEHLLFLAGGSHLPGHQGSKPMLNREPGCLCTAHRPTEKGEVSWDMPKKKETGEQGPAAHR